MQFTKEGVDQSFDKLSMAPSNDITVKLYLVCTINLCNLQNCLTELRNLVRCVMITIHKQIKLVFAIFNSYHYTVHLVPTLD